MIAIDLCYEKTHTPFSTRASRDYIIYSKTAKEDVVIKKSYEFVSLH